MSNQPGRVAEFLLGVCKLQRRIRTLLNIYDGTIWEDCQKLKVIYYFCKTLHHRLGSGLNTSICKIEGPRKSNLWKIEWTKVNKKFELTKSKYFSQDFIKGNFTFTYCTSNSHLLMNYVHETTIGLGVVINQNLSKKWLIIIFSNDLGYCN